MTNETKEPIKTFSMFSGIGGFEYGLQQSKHNFKIIGFSEIGEKQISIYLRHFPNHHNYGDASKIQTEELPSFDFLVAGFPCQDFSIAGKRAGLDGTRGTLFFEIARILKDKRPKYFLLENVKGLLSHGHGKTFQTILKILTDLGYIVQWEVFNSKYWVPQNRERIFIKGYLGRECSGKILSSRRTCSKDTSKKLNNLICLNKKAAQAQKIYSPQGVSPTLSACGGGDGGKTGLYIVPDNRKINVVGNTSPSNYQSARVISPEGIARTLTATDYKHPTRIIEKKETITRPVLTPDRVNKRQNGRRMKEDGEPSFTLTATDRHGVYDGYRIRKLTPVECERLQAFPSNWTKYGKDGELISDTQRYVCCGNAVTTSVITAIVDEMFDWRSCDKN
jgi:DNA (cytosine-5)-methyltransferase 1